MILETKRLILRKPKKSDWKDIVEGCKELDVAKNISTIPNPYKKKDAELFIENALKKWRKKDKDGYMFFIELKDEKKVIGSTSLYSINKLSKKAKTGSWINKKYWRKGYILEAKISILDFAFNKLKLEKLESGARVKNRASNLMSKNLGFKNEGTKRKSTFYKATNEICDMNIYGLLKSEWKENRSKIIKRLNKY
jgi:[ribosomal protein S5]-alanine N-acetyltransferase